MSFFFTFEDASRPKCHYEFGGANMAIMVEVMRNVRAIREQGGDPDFTLLPEGVAQAKFRSNSNQLVTPDECRLIAERLRAGLQDGSAMEVLCFFDDAPDGKEGRDWIAAWADYNERAAVAGGYRVT
jgi:hypothetical protein